MIKIITFWVGVDVLGFPIIHQHKLKYEEKRFVIGFDPASKGDSHSVAATYNPRTGVATYVQRKHLDNEQKIGITKTSD